MPAQRVKSPVSALIVDAICDTLKQPELKLALFSSWSDIAMKILSSATQSSELRWLVLQQLPKAAIVEDFLLLRKELVKHLGES